MKMMPGRVSPQLIDSEWLAFKGGELEGRRPTALCPACRTALRAAAASGVRATPRPLCFHCYRATLERERALRAAGELDTASHERFQVALPLEPVNRSRLARLRVERVQARTGRPDWRRPSRRQAAAGADCRASRAAAARRRGARTQRARRRTKPRDLRRASRRGAAAAGVVAAVRRGAVKMRY